MVQIFLTKTTTVTVQSCSGRTPVDAPVAKTFQVEGGPVLQIFMTLALMTFPPKFLSNTATALVVDIRRLNGSYGSPSSTTASAQVDVVTSSLKDAQALQAFVNSKLRTNLAMFGLKVVSISTNILLPTQPPTMSESVVIDLQFALAIGLGAGVPLLLFACFYYYLRKSQGKKKAAAAAANPKQALDSYPLAAAPVDSGTEAVDSGTEARLDFPISASPPRQGDSVYLTTSPDLLYFDQKGSNDATAQVQEPVVFMHQQQASASLQPPTVRMVVPVHSGVVVTSPLQTMQLASPQTYPPELLTGSPSAQAPTPQLPLHAWEFPSLPGTVELGNATSEVHNFNSTMQPELSEEGFWA